MEAEAMLFGLVLRWLDPREVTGSTEKHYPRGGAFSFGENSAPEDRQAGHGRRQRSAGLSFNAEMTK
jgi:hypothetical protein